MNHQKSTILWIFGSLTGLRLWRTRMLFLTKFKCHKSKFRISWMYRYSLYGLKVHFWWLNECLVSLRSSWNTLYIRKYGIHFLHWLFCFVCTWHYRWVDTAVQSISKCAMAATIAPALSAKSADQFVFILPIYFTISSVFVHKHALLEIIKPCGLVLEFETWYGGWKS